ncbi:MAG: hypothetical protein DI598_15370 [Pseudopedobacter saltans]|uniref:Ketoreductase domain-containing protein n=1 Tax=Pseudopedobacter saltans TaxID=151895 RepID=A0A2W5EHD5_9SPHI|nr:MAG: hypothetical protein DI598_15370 [Pseudopedobacter saltans]
MHALNLKGKWVLVTGASSGLGREMATQLAKNHNANLIIVARRMAQLEVLKSELESQHQIEVKVLAADLSKKDEVLHVYDVATKQVGLSAVILSAGVTYFGKDILISDDNIDSLIQTNIAAMAILMQRFTKYFEGNSDDCGLLVVSSMAAISPAPYQALYSGTKAFIYGYAQALSAELENKKFSISIFAPGGIQTEMTSNGSFDGLEKWLMPVSTVAKAALNGFVNRKLIIVPGFSNKFGANFFKFLPKKFLLGKLGSVYRKALENKGKKG